jgi:hypothetical protein
MKEILIRPDNRKLRRYSTGLWSTDLAKRPRPPYNGRGWAIGLRLYQHIGPDLPRQLERLQVRLGFLPTANIPERTADGSSRWQSAFELLIFARDREGAQRAANLLFAAILLYEGQSLVHESLIAVPEDKAERSQYHPLELHRDVGYSCQSGLTTAAALAARLSTRRTWQYAAMKYWASHRACSLPLIETDPSQGRSFGVEADPINHVIFAQAIITAYAVIEELGFEIQASRNNPSTIKGEWNQTVKEDLEQRLTKGGIDIRDDEIWMVRGPRTRIESARGYPAGDRPSWSRGLVRDRRIKLIDAIARASWLRSSVSAHKLSKKSKLSLSLTVTDVVNVQLLARRLVLEQTGFLPGKSSQRHGKVSSLPAKQEETVNALEKQAALTKPSRRRAHRGNPFEDPFSTFWEWDSKEDEAAFADL